MKFACTGPSRPRCAIHKPAESFVASAGNLRVSVDLTCQNYDCLGEKPKGTASLHTWCRLGNFLCPVNCNPLIEDSCI